MADQLEGARTLPVKFKDAGDGSAREILEVRNTDPTQPGWMDLVVASALALANAASHSATKYIGITVSETAGAAAKVRIRDGNGGTILDTIPLSAGEGVSYTYPRGRAVAGGTLYVEIASGAVEGAAFYQ